MYKIPKHVCKSHIFRKQMLDNQSLFLSSPRVIPNPPSPHVTRDWSTSSTEKEADLDVVGGRRWLEGCVPVA